MAASLLADGRRRSAPLWYGIAAAVAASRVHVRIHHGSDVVAGAAIGLGNLFGQFYAGALRNPSAADGQRGNLLLGFARTEALGIFSLLVALLLLFAV